MRLCPTCQSRYTGDANVCPIDGTSLVAIPDPMVGRTIGGRYRVDEVIGRGGMGTVYRGRHQLVGRDVALKFLAPKYARDPSARERFLREARAANRIDHEHIIDITDFGETTDSLVFLVMEFLEGKALSEIVAEGPLSPQRAVTIAHQVASALARAHELDVVHRDIKPDNIFLVQRRGKDFSKLLDFGLAKVTGEHRLTADGKVFGTPEYLSPEQARGEPLTGAADQYALGVVLFEMLTGTLPFEGSSAEVVLSHLQAPAPAPSSRASQLPSEVDALVLRMMSKQVTDRHVDAYHLAEELSALMELLNVRQSARPSPSSPLNVSTAAATQPWLDAAEETWAQRATLYRSVLPEAFGRDVPAGVAESLGEMERLVQQARRMRASLTECVLGAKTHEDKMRHARMQMGRAVDELGQDESRVARRVAEAQAAVARHQQRAAEMARPLEQLRQQLAPRLGQGPLDRDLAESFRQLGGQAALWLEADQALREQLPRLERSQREQEDLRFQIAQLKGRIGILTAEGEAELSQLRASAEELGSELARVLESITRVAAPVSDALMAVPAARQKLAQSATSQANTTMAHKP